MPLVLANRVQETTATTGTGTITLAGAVSGYQSFAAIGNGNTTYYTITSGTAWEVGIGTYSTTGPTLARTTILSSSAGGAAITLVGVSTVFSTYPANRSVNYDETNSLTLSGTAISAPAWTTTGIGIKQVATTYTDTTSTGTVPNVYINSFAAQTLAATNTITVSQLYGIFFNTPTAGTNVTATERWSIGTDTLRVTGGILMDGGAGNFIQIATGMTTGQFILGNTAGTGTMTLGRSTVTQTTNIQGGSTTSGNTKTINFGSGGLAGSTTNITIGSSAGTSITTLNGTVSVTSTIAAALGSAAAPSYTFTGDTNTGMWSPAADTIAFSGGGVEAMRITSAGNVGIGTTAPLARLFAETPTTVGAAIAFAANSNGAYPTGVFGGSFGYNFSAGGAEVDFWNGWTGATGGQGGFAFRRQTGASSQNLLMTIQGDGNVGIGTSAPVQRLHVRQDQNGTTAALIQNRNGSGTPVSAVQFISGAFDLTDNRYAMISSAGGSNTTLQFWTGSGATPTERARVDASGNLLVGTTSATGRLTVETTGSNVGYFDTTDTTAGPKILSIRSIAASGTSTPTLALRQWRTSFAGSQNAGEIRFDGLTTTGSYAEFASIYATSAANSASGAPTAITFQTMNASYATGERMRIDSAGNVGIGTASPGAKLDVVGNASFGAAITTGTGLSTGDAQLEVGGNRSGNGAAYMDLHAVAGGDFSARVLRTSGTNGNMEIANAGTGVLTIATNGTEKMRVESGGNVGIGTTAPTTIFHVQQNNAGNIGMRMRQLSTTQFAGAGLLCNGPVSSGAQGGTGFYHYNRNTGGTNGAAAIAQFDETGAFQRTLAEYYYQEQAWIFYTNSNERFRITSAGDVGIGTSSPGAKLDITGNIRLSAAGPNIEFNNGGGMVYGPAANTLAFATGGGPASPVERLRILSTGGITSSDLADAVGYKGVPQNSQTASYTLALSDMGKHISITTGGVVIPANSSVAFPIGSTITVYNNSGTAQNISITTDTLRLAGTATSGTRSLAQRGLATCIKVAATEWVVTGNVT